VFAVAPQRSIRHIALCRTFHQPAARLDKTYMVTTSRQWI